MVDTLVNDVNVLVTDILAVGRDALVLILIVAGVLWSIELGVDL